MIKQARGQSIWLVVASIAWLVFASASIVQLALLNGNACAINSSWLVCQSPLSGYGQLGVWVALSVLTASFAFAGNAVWDTRIAQSWRKKFVFVSVCCALVSFPFGSSDMQYYKSAGIAVENGVNVYTTYWDLHVPLSAEEQNREAGPVPYAPIMPTVFQAITSLTGDSLVAFIFVWRALMVVSLIGVVFVLQRLLHALGKQQEQAWAFAAMPLVVFEWIGSGHFEGVWLIPFLLAFWFGHKAQWVRVIACLTIGIWMKFLPVFAVPWFMLWWWQETKGNLSQQISDVFWGTIVAFGLTYILWKPYWVGFETIEPILLQSKWALSSIFSVVYYSFQPIAEMLLGTEYHFYLTRLVHGLLAAMILYMLWPLVGYLVQILRSQKKLTLETMLLSVVLTYLLYLMLWQKSFWPWYVTWILPLGIPLVVGESRQWLRSLLRHISIAPFIFYPVFLGAWFMIGIDTASQLWFWYVIVFSVWGVPAYLLWKARKHGYGLD